MQKIGEFQQQNNIPVTRKLDKVTCSKLSEVLGIPSKEHLAHFLGQVHHETGGFSLATESLNYSVQALLTSFGRHRISEVDARRFGRTTNQVANQQEIANRIYGGNWGRTNLGNTQPNDGWNFRGRGAIQLTGRANYQAFADYVKDQSVMINPDLVATRYYFESAKFFFDRNRIWRFCNLVNDNTILTVSKAINLGNPNHKGTPKGLLDRTKQTNNYYNIIK